MELCNVRILEGKSLLWDDITKAYKKEVFSEDYITMHSPDYNRLRTLSTTKPFFSNTYIVEIHLTGVTSKVLNQLKRCMESPWMCLIMVVNNKDDFEALSNICRTKFNGYKISYNYWYGYVSRRLKCNTQCNMENIYKSLSGRYELTDVIVDAINKSNGKCTVASLKRLIGKAERMSLDLAWFSILRMDCRDKKNVFKYLEEYRFGYAFIYKSLCSKYESLIQYYKDFRYGKFNETNLREFKKEKKVSEWTLNNYLDLFSDMSFDEIQVIGEILYCSKVDSTASLFALVGKLYNRKNLIGGDLRVGYV